MVDQTNSSFHNQEILNFGKNKMEGSNSITVVGFLNLINLLN